MSLRGENLGFIPNAGGTLGQTDRLRKVVRTLPLASIACDVTFSSPPSLGGFSGFSNEQERSWKRVQSAGTSHHRDALYCSRPAGNYQKTTKIRFDTALYAGTVLGPIVFVSWKIKFYFFLNPSRKFHLLLRWSRHMHYLLWSQKVDFSNKSISYFIFNLYIYTNLVSMLILLALLGCASFLPSELGPLAEAWESEVSAQDLSCS